MNLSIQSTKSTTKGLEIKNNLDQSHRLQRKARLSPWFWPYDSLSFVHFSSYEKN